MSELPARLSPGQRLTAHWLNRLLDFLRARELRAGPGIRLARTPSGTTVSAAAAGTAAGETERVFPALITGRSGDEYTATVYDPVNRREGSKSIRLFLTEVCQEADVPTGAIVLAHEIAVRSIPDTSED